MTSQLIGERVLPVLFRYRTAVVILLQLGLVVGAYIASFVLRLDLDFAEVPWGVVLKTLPLLIVLRMGSLAVFRLYKGLWQYVGIMDLLQILKATTVSTLAFAGLEIAIFGLEGFPRSVFFLDWMGNILLLSGIRVLVRLSRERYRPLQSADRSFRRLLIVGAGDTGAELSKQVLSSKAFRFKPVAFVDDNTTKIGTSIQGIPIAGPCKDIPRVVSEYNADMAVIAIPSATPSERRTLVEFCQSSGVPFKILPAMPDLLEGAVSISRIRDVDPADLLGRPPAKLDRAAIQSFITGKRVLVTGAAGSVGSELARQIAGLRPMLLLLIDRGENPLMFLEREIVASSPDLSLVAQVIDVTDQAQVRRLMEEHSPQVVFHAAAYKHVPLMERAAGEALKNNVGGTYVVAKCAQDAGTKMVVLVSTDKAVNPSSVMGATKRLAELLVQEMDSDRETRYVSVRFGNVLGSNASVVPIFKQQIAEGGPVTVTHPDVERYFMSISEAASLILQAGAVGKGGEIFFLDMGEPVRIVTLAETLITLSGFKPFEEIDIVFTNLRPGEKLSEELLLDGEEFEQTEYEKLRVLKGGRRGSGVVREVEEFLRVLPDLEFEDVKARLRSLIPEYHQTSSAAEIKG